MIPGMSEFAQTGPEMLAGTRELGPSMFSGLTPDPKPSTADMERAAEAALYDKTVKFKGITTKTFNLSVAKQLKEYNKVLEEIFAGIQAQTHVILCRDRRFVEAPEPRWYVHMEWAEYELRVEAVPPIGTPKTD